jgi:hypothetical protein
MTLRLISYSLYGSANCYRVGALRNLDAAGRMYPGWTCRFYVWQEIPVDLVSRLEAGGAEVVRKRRRVTWMPSGDPMLWRFLPAGESGIDAVIVRDADSILEVLPVT